MAEKNASMAEFLNPRCDAIRFALDDDESGEYVIDTLNIFIGS